MAARGAPVAKPGFRDWGGRPRIGWSAKEVREFVRSRESQGLTTEAAVQEAMREMGLSRATVFRRLRLQ